MRFVKSSTMLFPSIYVAHESNLPTWYSNEETNELPRGPTAEPGLRWKVTASCESRPWGVGGLGVRGEIYVNHCLTCVVLGLGDARTSKCPSPTQHRSSSGSTPELHPQPCNWHSSPAPSAMQGCHRPHHHSQLGQRAKAQR